jgi:hypothetical protein
VSQDINKDGRVSKWEAFPYWFDKLRVFPRIFISIYIYVFYDVIQWFMSLPEPNIAQSGLVSVVTGAGAAWFGLYVNSGINNAANPVVVQSSPRTIVSTAGARTSRAASSYQEPLDEDEPIDGPANNYYR